MIRTKFYYNCSGSPPTTVSYLVGLAWNGVPNEANKIPIILEGLGYMLLHTAHSWQSEGFGPVQQFLTTALLCNAEWCDSKFRYWFVWMILQYTKVVMEPPFFLVRRMSKKGSCRSDSFSTVNWMLLSMLLRWLWKESTRSPGSTVQVSSTYHFRNAEEYGKLTAPFVRCPLSPSWRPLPILATPWLRHAPAGRVWLWKSDRWTQGSVWGSSRCRCPPPSMRQQ